MAIAKGVLLGPYEILNRIGEGGMGEVWRARDKRIGRDVAVKVLPESFQQGDERILRFEQEARAAGALNHPGLVTIFDVGTTSGSPYIVMELLEGENLRDAIGEVDPVPLPLRKAVNYATQAASALAVAHEKGIVHRDLKPENIFITADHRVKILDFGLAKLAAESTDTDGRHRTARHLTSAGIAVGTPGYMSPEQVRAQPLDYRTDIFSLGSVIYEMLTARPAFECFSAVETMHAVMNVEPPPMATLVPNVPPALDAIVRHCMEKNPRERFQSARDLAFQLQILSAEVENRTTDIRRTPMPVPKRRPYRAAIAAAAAVVALAAVGGWALFRARGGSGQATPRVLKQLTFANGLELFPTLAPDGKSFAYVSSQSGNRDIYVQRVDGRTAVNITSDSPSNDSEPAFSADGSQIAFRSERSGGGIFVMGVTGESVRRLTDFGHNPSWSPDGKRIVVATQRVELQPRNRMERFSELWLIDAQSGAKRPLLQKVAGAAASIDAVQPSWSPHGDRIAYWGLSDDFGSRDLWTIDPNAPEPKQTVVPVTSDRALDWNPAWSPDGKYLYFGSDRDGTMNLWRMAIDEKTGKPGGAPEPMSLPAVFTGHFTVSQAGPIAYASVARSYRVVAMPFDAATGQAGPPRTVLEGSMETLSFDPSPDGQSLAFTTGGVQEDLFLVDAGGEHLRQLTNDAARDRGVAWSSDGKTIYLYSNRDGALHVWSIGADGGGLTRVTDARDLERTGAQNLYEPEVSPDGRTLAAQTDAFPGLIHLDRPQGQRFEKLGGSADEVRTASSPAWSPDGKRLVLSLRSDSPTSGILVYSLATRQFQAMTGQGVLPQWLPDGRHIAFFQRNSIGIVDVESQTVTASPFTTLPGVDVTTAYPRLSRDGSTLYMRQTLEQGDIWMLQPGG
jgi:eukaryotic-like serine/threonine-protein kinase